eukprot:27858-Amphidinium_carterae.2
MGEQAVDMLVWTTLQIASLRDHRELVHSASTVSQEFPRNFSYYCLAHPGLDRNRGGSVMESRKRVHEDAVTDGHRVGIQARVRTATALRGMV